MSSAKVVLFGMPTRLEVQKLLDRWPVSEMKAGDVYCYDDVADTVDVAVKGYRFKSVTDAWRKKIERETGIRIAPDGSGTMFRVLSESEKVDAICTKRISLNRQGRKNMIRTGYVDRKQLNDEQKATFDFITANERKILSVSMLRKGIAHDRQTVTDLPADS